MEEAVQRLKQDGNVVILLSRLERIDIHPPNNLGYKTMQIDTDEIAKDTDGFMEGRVDKAKAEAFKEYLKQYDSSITGYYLTKLFLTKIFQTNSFQKEGVQKYDSFEDMNFPIENENNRAVLRYITDPSIRHEIGCGKPLTKTQLYEAQTDYQTGLDIHKQFPHLGDEEVRKRIIDLKEQLAEKAFNDIFGNKEG
jgi:hypothetical protein